MKGSFSKHHFWRALLAFRGVIIYELMRTLVQLRFFPVTFIYPWSILLKLYTEPQVIWLVLLRNYWHTLSRFNPCHFQCFFTPFHFQCIFTLLLFFFKMSSIVHYPISEKFGHALFIFQFFTFRSQTCFFWRLYEWQWFGAVFFAIPYFLLHKGSTQHWYLIQYNQKVWLWYIQPRRNLLITLPETNIAHENRPLEKEIPIGNHHFYGRKC